MTTFTGVRWQEVHRRLLDGDRPTSICTALGITMAGFASHLGRLRARGLVLDPWQLASTRPGAGPLPGTVACRTPAGIFVQAPGWWCTAITVPKRIDVDKPGLQGDSDYALVVHTGAGFSHWVHLRGQRISERIVGEQAAVTYCAPAEQPDAGARARRDITLALGYAAQLEVILQEAYA